MAERMRVRDDTLKPATPEAIPTSPPSTAIVGHSGTIESVVSPVESQQYGANARYRVVSRREMTR